MQITCQLGHICLREWESQRVRESGYQESGIQSFSPFGPPEKASKEAREEVLQNVPEEVVKQRNI